MISYFRLILQNVTNIINRMLYKVRVLETNVSAFSQRAAILALMGKLMKVMLCTVNIMKICTYGVMEWRLNSGSVFFFWIVDGYRFAEQFAYVVLYWMPSWERSYRWYCMYTFFLFGLHVALQIIIKNSSQWIITQWSFNNFLQWIIKKYFKHFLVELIPILSF